MTCILTYGNSNFQRIRIVDDKKICKNQIVISMNEDPLCSVIVLNYFGEKVIKNTLNSLLQLDYPKDKLEIIVVDNNSKDKSREIIKDFARPHGNIKLITLEKNLGFSKGNNVGIKKSQGKYVILLNNDCVVEKAWLKELVKVAESDEKIFAVNSKILIYPKFINFPLKINDSLVPIYAWLSKSHLYQTIDNIVYLTLGKKDENFIIEVPTDPILDNRVEVKILFNVKEKVTRKDITSNKIVEVDEKIAKIKSLKVTKQEVALTLEINTNSSLFKAKSLNKIQNAGIVVFQDGYGRDIGAIVRGNEQFYEYDHGQYDNIREVYAACGASMLMRKNILEQLGYLDESFFMYYEDVDIAEKARISGYKVFYAPKSKARHIHALSSKEWSPFFIYHVEKGRLLHLFFNFPYRIFLYEYLKLFSFTVLSGIVFIFKYRKYISFINRKKSSTQETSEYRKKVMYLLVTLYFIGNFFVLVPKKLKLIFSRKSGEVGENYSKILRGDWYAK